MIWLTWRQFRTQAIVGAAALVLLAAYLLYLGVDIRHGYDAYRGQCLDQGGCAQAMSQFAGDYQSRLLILAALLQLVPGVLGMFWGAPLVAREFEAGTHRLVWSQSVARPRWYVVKFALVGLASVLVVGLASTLLTWAASPVDQVAGDRFSTIVFGARGVVPFAYAIFAFALGTTIGVLVRRTVPAMALTLLVYLAIQFAMPNLVRPHLMPPVHASRPMTAAAINEAHGLGSLTGGAVIRGLAVPGAWVTQVSDLLTTDGRPLDGRRFNDCLMRPPKVGASGTFGDIAPCLGALDLHVEVAYQPNRRYWPFQYLESAGYLALSGLLAVAGYRRLQRRN